MAVKGSFAKAEITEKIMEVFSGSFLYNGGKEIRIPCVENGEVVQIKVTLTAAKVAVNPEDENAVPTPTKVEKKNEVPAGFPNVPSKATHKVEITPEEQAKVDELFKLLNV